MCAHTIKSITVYPVNNSSLPLPPSPPLYNFKINCFSNPGNPQ